MKYAHAEVFDVLVFDKNDNLIVDLNTLKLAQLSYITVLETYVLLVKDALLNTDFLTFIGKVNKVTDYEKFLTKQSSSISITKNFNKPCKIIAKTYMVEADTNISKPVTIEIPSAETISNLSLCGEFANVSTFDALFKVIPVEDEFFKVHI